MRQNHHHRRPSEIGEQEHVPRAHNRFVLPCSVCIIDSTIYPIVDWSMGGVQIVADPRMFSQNQELELILKFKLQDSIVEIPCNGEIVRKATDRLGIKLEPLNQEAHQLSMKVLDSCVVNEFANSQAND